MKTWHYNKKVEIESKKELGNINTHPLIANVIINSFVPDELINENTKFLEPAVGSGSFYFAILDKLLSLGFDKEKIIEEMIYAWDIDNNVLNILKDKLISEYGYHGNKALIFNEDFLTQKIDTKFDFIITNPPYISYKNIKPLNGTKEEYIKNIKEINDIEFDNTSDLYIMFYLKTLKLLKDKGIQVFLCADSWIDCEYGDSLKSFILSNEYNLDYIVSSQLYPFFRDDTNAIITVISKTKKANTNVISIKQPIDEINDIKTLKKDAINKSRLEQIMKDEDILNKRNVLILHGLDYFEMKKCIEKYDEFLSPLDKNIEVSSTSVSQSTLQKNNWLKENTKKGIPLFWQIQARVNRKPNYKNFLKHEEFAYEIKEDVIDKKYLKNIKDFSVYLSGIIDRFPLVFFTDTKSFHVSKYLHLYSNTLSPIEICLSLNNIFTIYNMELDLKEGTRKTLRRGEMGLTKEIKKEDLKKLLIIDFTKFKKETRDEISKIGDKYKNKIVYNIEEALKDDDYIKIQKIIAEEIGMTDKDFEYIKNNALKMYYFRMRNLKKLKNIKKM